MRSTCQRCGGKGSIINTPCTEVQAKKKKTMTSKPKKVSLSVGELIVKAVAASKERNGLSVAALKKALAAGGYNVDKNKARVKTAIKSLVAKGTLVQTKGTGASGSFKMNRVTETKAKTPAAAKAKKPAAAAKKSPRKAAAAALQPLKCVGKAALRTCSAGDAAPQTCIRPA
uniref:Histone H1 n=1 Tax=Astatotilapia calliptera TaxID=8154 RepID=A0AAX7SSS0_ASTCA